MNIGRYLRFQYYKMLRVKDTPSKVAQGVGIGLALDAAIPIPLVSIFVSFVVARTLKMNSVAAVIAGTAIKPFFIFIVALNVYVQGILVTAFPFLINIRLPRAEGTNIFEKMINSVVERGGAYLLAGCINGLAIFFISSGLLYYLLVQRINRLKHKKHKK